ncbi:hypothetical protein AN958_04769 [Leucoagaricus sp. SymC.cos]|nr:hypothetical protein AN958_04769 [Leucoagaricus sp. SymC.cos]
MPSSNPPNYGVWYRTPSLQPGLHTVVFNDLPRATLDYIIVGVDPNTTFENTLVLVSDSDPVITYTGNWQQDVSRFQTLQPFKFLGDYSTRSTCNPGDTFSLDFAGTDIQLWGVFDWSLVGDVTAAYTIDGQQIAEQRYEASQTSQERIYGVQTNFPLFSKNGLSGALHTLVVNITSCTNQRFSLDYITYTPSFTAGRDAPTMTASPAGPSQKSSSKFPTSAIAGIVVGAVVFVVIAILIFWLHRKRRRTVAEPFAASSTVAVTRKEEVPPRMRQLRSAGSQETVDLTEGTSTNGTWVIAPRSSELRNINELVSAAPPPAYPNHSNTRVVRAETTTESTNRPTTRSPS